MLATESLLITLRYSLGAGGRSCANGDEAEEAEDPWRSFDVKLTSEYQELRESLGDLAALLKSHGADVGGWVSGGDKWAALWGAAVVERVQRGLGGLIDRQQALLQPAAEIIGNGIRKRSPDNKVRESTILHIWTWALLCAFPHLQSHPFVSL